MRLIGRHALTSPMTYRTVRVAAVHDLTRHMRRITFRGSDLRGVADAGPDQAIKLFLPRPGQCRPQLPPEPADGDVLSWYRRYFDMPDDVRPTMRTYTIRHLRAEDEEMTVDFVHHATGGPAARWVCEATVGEQVAFIGPSGSYPGPPERVWQLLIGDESALPAIGAIIEALPDGVLAKAFVEVVGPDDEQTFDSSGDVAVHWVHRGAATHGRSLIDAMRGARLPDGPCRAWVSGEASMVKTVRRHLVNDRAVDKSAITFSGYWRMGKTEEEESAAAIRRIEAGEPADDDAD